MKREGHRTGLVAGHYRLLGLLGEGGMGEVYEAIHQAIDRKFAIKLLRPSLLGDADASTRFAREARVVGALECEQIVGVFDYGVLEDGAPYLVMERLRGDDLKSVLAVAGTLSVERTLMLAMDVCRGLDAAHRAGLIHRDLKPANLFLCRKPGGETGCKILDFGVARESGATSSVLANVVGTARYMAPEQILNGAKITPATDLYALGAIIYECLSGVRVHDGNCIESVLFSVIHDEPKPLSELASGVPERLSKLVERLLRKRPEERFQSGLELLDALRELAPPPGNGRELETAQLTDVTRDADAEVTAGPVSFPATVVARRPWRALGTLLALVTVGALGYWWGSSNLQRQARSASPSAPTPTLAVNATVCPAPAAAPAPVVAAIASPKSKQPRASAARPKPAMPPSTPSAIPLSGAELFVGQNPYETAP